MTLSEPMHRFAPLRREYRGVIFDFDGTLVDSMPLHFRAWRAALSAHAAPFEFSWELFLRRAGKTLEVTVDELNLEFGVALDRDAVARSQRATYEELVPGIGPVAPVIEFARGLYGQVPFAIASGGDQATIRRSLSALSLLDWFPVIVTAADVVHGKPAPDMFLLAAERIGVEPADCVVFEDGLLGIEAARRAGMDAVFVERVAIPAT